MNKHECASIFEEDKTEMPFFFLSSSTAIFTCTAECLVHAVCFQFKVWVLKLELLISWRAAVGS